MTTDPKSKLLEFIPPLRHAFADAKREGEPQLAVVASKPDGSGRVIARFNGDEFLTDLCGLLGVPTANSEEEELNAAADMIVSMFGPVHRE